MSPAAEWLSTEEAANEIGCVSSRWVRTQIEVHRLPARAITVGRRVTYRIRRRDLDAFVAQYVRDAWEWHAERDEGPHG